MASTPRRLVAAASGSSACASVRRPSAVSSRSRLSPELERRSRSFCHERRSPPARSRGRNHVSPTSPLLTVQRGGTSRFPHTPSTHSWAKDRPMSTYDPFAEIYDEWAAVMTEDVAFYVELAREADGPIVELGVGT